MEPAIKARTRQNGKFKSIQGRTPGQKQYIRTLNESLNQESALVLVHGPPGVGKSKVAITWALEQVYREKFSKLIISQSNSRHQKELGFLPGGLQEKCSVLFAQQLIYCEEAMGVPAIKQMVDGRKIETLPIQILRSRDFTDSVIICDETQLCSREDVRLLVSRLGKHSLMILLGDFQQVEDNRLSFFEKMFKIDKPSVSQVMLTYADCCRHKDLVEIMEAIDQLPH